MRIAKALVSIGVTVGMAASASSARAQPVQIVTDALGSWDESPPPDDSDWRSPTVARVLSSGVTLGGAVLLADGVSKHDDTLLTTGAVAFAIGPSLGHWYSGEGWNVGLETRIGGALVGAAGVGLALACRDGDRDACAASNDVIIFGAAAYVVGAVYEVSTAERAAREHNRARAEASIALAPVAGRDGAVPGLVLAGRF